MVSTFIEYNLVSRDMKTSLQRTSQQTLVSREAAYYKENIGNVTTIDAFLDDYRLYAYAMKAHGLEDMTYAKAFMRKVMESDLSDDNSYANLLTDDRYRNFAQAFSFSQSTEVVQSDAQQDDLIGLYSQSIVNRDDAVKEDTRYFNTMIDSVTSVDGFLQNEKARSYVFTAFGIDQKYYNYEEIRGVLTSDLNDPNSYFKTVIMTAAADAQTQINSATATISNINERDTALSQITAITASLAGTDLSDDERAALETSRETYQTRVNDLDAVLPPRTESSAYRTRLTAQIVALNTNLNKYADYEVLAAAFSFNADGSVTPGQKALDDTAKASINQSYVFLQPRTSWSAAQISTVYYQGEIQNVTKISDITSDSRLFSYLRTAYALPAGFLTTTLENILTSDLSNPTSYANTQGGVEYSAVYKELAAAFNFQTDGTLAAGDKAQDSAQMALTSAYWSDRYNDADDAADDALISSFKTLIGIVSDVDDLLDDKKIMQLALTAVGLENEGDTARKLRKVLTSDLTDPDSYVYTLKDERYVNLAKAFNFNTDGSIGTPMLAQAESEILNTAKSYVIEKSRFGTDAEKTKATEEAKYYSAEIGKIETLDELLSNRRVVDFILVAAGIDPETVTTDYVRKMFQSDFDDPKSLINTEPETTRYKEIVSSYNFDSEGNLARPERSIQTRRGLLETEDLYLNQTMEEEKGQDNAGVRLALYFRRMATGIGSAYDILADTALLQVIQTAYSIPEGLSSADVDVQYAYINRLLEIEDLHDPEKLEKLLVRFTALYDVENNVDVSAAELIMSGNGSGGISADALFSLAQLRLGGA